MYGENLVTREVMMEWGGTEEVHLRNWVLKTGKLAGAMIGGAKTIHVRPGMKVMYLCRGLPQGGEPGQESWPDVSHISDIVGLEGQVFAIDHCQLSSMELVRMANQRPNLIPIFADPRVPDSFPLTLPKMDVLICDLPLHDMAHVAGENARRYLKVGGGFIFFIDSFFSTSTAAPEDIYVAEIEKLRNEHLTTTNRVEIDRWFVRQHVAIGVYQPPSRSETHGRNARVTRVLRPRK